MEKIKNTTDRRVLKTKKAIRNAFAELILEKNISDITVTDVANKADVNRKTFYNYYGCMEDLIKEIEDEFLRIFEEDLKTIDMVDDFPNPAFLFQRLTILIESDLQLYSALFKTDGAKDFMYKIENLLTEKSKAFFLEKHPEDAENVNLICEYCIAGTCTAFRYWFNSDRQMSHEEVSQKVSSLTSGAIQHLLGVM